MTYRDAREALESERASLLAEREDVQRRLESVEKTLLERSALPLLSLARVATPCSARWEDMQGNERQRFCGKCQKHVYNFAEMSAAEAEGLLANSDELCARLFRRWDGTILTSDCPVGRKRKWLGGAAALAGLVGVSAGVALSGSQPSGGMERSHLTGAIALEEDEVSQPMVMGSVMVPAEAAPALPPRTADPAPDPLLHPRPQSSEH